MDPLTSALIGGGAQALGSIGSGLLARNRKKPEKTKRQRQKEELIDQLLNSLQGGGPYSDLFEMDEAGFQKSIVDPAKARFRNQIAPQIKQSYIAGGQQGGTGLEDSLARAGVDLDQMINEQYLNYSSGARDRKAQLIQSILGGGDGYDDTDYGLSTEEKFRDSAAGYLTSDGFSESIDRILDAASRRSTQPARNMPRRGFSQ